MKRSDSFASRSPPCHARRDRCLRAAVPNRASPDDHSVPARRHARHAWSRDGAEARRPDWAIVRRGEPSGGNGIIGADAVAKAQADGYTLLFNASTFVTAPMTMKQVPYAIEKDFTPIALVAKAPLSVAIAKDRPVTDIRSLIAYAKANGDKTTFAVGSIGSAGHLGHRAPEARGGHRPIPSCPIRGRRRRTRTCSAVASTASSTRFWARSRTTRRGNCAWSP